MATKRTIKTVLLLGAGLFMLQYITYFTLGPSQLIGKLLPEHFQMTHKADTAFISDHLDGGCGTNPGELISVNIRSHPDILKKRLNVKNIEFHLFEDKHHLDHYLEKKLTYTTWTSRTDWLTLFNFFKVYQHEILTIDNQYHYERTVTYQWVLFFWVERFESLRSSDLSLRKKIAIH